MLPNNNSGAHNDDERRRDRHTLRRISSAPDNQQQPSLPSIRSLHPYLPPSGMLSGGSGPPPPPEGNTPYQQYSNPSIPEHSSAPPPQPQPSSSSAYPNPTSSSPEQYRESEAEEVDPGPPKKKRRRQALSCTGMYSSTPLAKSLTEQNAHFIRCLPLSSSYRCYWFLRPPTSRLTSGILRQLF
jgi:hypothetical protein